MLYKFQCPKCGKKYEVAIKMEDYDKEKGRQICEKDGSHLDRVIEFDGFIGQINGAYGVGKNGWNT